MTRREGSGLLWASVFAAIVVGVLTTPCRSELFSTRVPGLETWYGGFFGPVYREAAFDFSQTFILVREAWLHIEATPDFPQVGHWITYMATLEGAAGGGDFVILGPWEDLVVDIPLPSDLPDMPLDGKGTVGLDLSTDEDGISVVGQATLWFDATPVPEPTSLALLSLGALALRRRRR